MGFETLNSTDGLTVKAYRGAQCVLFAFDLDEPLLEGFQGFAIQCHPPSGNPFFLRNRLSYDKPATGDPRKLTPSVEAPFQTFRWLHVPFEVLPGEYRYRIIAMYADRGQARLREGAETVVSLELLAPEKARFKLGFTRGYIASQAYSDRFHNAPFAPDPKSLDADLSSFSASHLWLGHHARKLLLGFLNECLQDPSSTVDVMAYDFDEPEIFRRLEKLGTRLRVILDSSESHRQENDLEIEVARRLRASAGDAQVVEGFFGRYAHNKTFVRRKNGKPTSVLTGSTNFTFRGLYAQANNVLILEDDHIADLYAQVFEASFKDMKGFKKSKLSGRWFDVSRPGLPRMACSFAPHKKAAASLDRVSQEIVEADSSVLFAMMGLRGSGPVLEALMGAARNPEIFSYGITETLKGFDLFKPNAKRGRLVEFDALDEEVPLPFRKEWKGKSGAFGHGIHHKFVVVDFNDTNPVVFTGSSNLTSGGEESNGDNLLAIYDRQVATAYAVEAIRLVDHHHFRNKVKEAGAPASLHLEREPPPGRKPWYAPYYAVGSLKERERRLLSR